MRFSASTGTVALGGQVDLTWEVSGTATVSISSDGDFEVSVSAAGVWTSPRLTEATRFTLRAENEAGVARAEVTVSVRRPPEPPAIERFRATPEEFSGERVEVGLSWRATGQLRLLSQGVELLDFPGQRASFFQVRVTEPTVFTLVALGEDGTEIRQEARVRRIGEELEPNDRRDDAQPIEPGVPIRGTITQGDVDWFAVQVPEGHSILAGLEPGCGFDSLLELWGPDPEWPLESRFLALNDNPSPDETCSRIDPATEPAAVELLGGLHYLAVRGFDRASVGAYRLSVETIPPGCGNGLVETGRGEQCDPPGEGCTAACAIEGLATHTGVPLDLELDVAVPVEIRLEEEGTIFGRAFGPDGECPAGAGIGLFDLDRTGGQTLYRVSEPAEPACRLPAMALPAGRYMVAVSGPAPLPLSLSARVRGCGDGILDRGEVCDEGGPTDLCGPDCRFRTVRVASPGASVGVDVPPSSIRFVRVPVPIPGSSISARVLGSSAGWQLELRDGGYFPLEQAPPGEALASLPRLHDRPAEDHVIAVSRISGGPATAQLEVQITPPACGDGIVQRHAGEQCDPLRDDIPCRESCLAETQISPFVGPAPLNDRTDEQITLGPQPETPLLFLVQAESVSRLRVGSGFPRPDCVGQGGAGLILFDGAMRPLSPTYSWALQSPPLMLQQGLFYLLLNHECAGSSDELELYRGIERSRCGDFITDANEECDGLAGSGCDPETCRFTSRLLRREQEPNDHFHTAEPLLPLRSVSLFGRVSAGDRDLFSIDVLPGDEVGLAANIASCDVHAFRLRDDRGNLVADATRLSSCRLILPAPLAPGRYYLEVSSEFPRPYSMGVEVP